MSDKYAMFALLCEQIVLNEYSPNLRRIQKKRGGEAIVRSLHKEYGLSHKQEYRYVEKISWNELKNASIASWALLICSRGVAAIKGKDGEAYQVLASTGDIVHKLKETKGGRILEWIESQVGSPQSIYVGIDSGDAGKLRKKRDELKTSASPTGKPNLDINGLIKKFRPLWIRTLTHSYADIKGVIQNMIKNDSFSKANKKIEHIKKIADALEHVKSSGEGTPAILTAAVRSAVYHAAHYYYPDQTPSAHKMTKQAGGINYDPGVRKILDDISAGDVKKLGTVLAFFKKALLVVESGRY